MRTSVYIEHHAVQIVERLGILVQLSAFLLYPALRLRLLVVLAGQPLGVNTVKPANLAARISPLRAGMKVSHAPATTCCRPQLLCRRQGRR